MPEGPEIHRLADELGDRLRGQLVEEVYLTPDRLKRFTGDLSGARVERIRARGKALLVEFDSGHVLYTHNQLYGTWRIVPRGEWPDTGRSLRVALHTATWSCLLYSATEIEVLDAAGVVVHPFLSRLGPDVLAADTRLETITARYGEPQFSRRQLGTLLLDQHFLAGLGNYLRSEILFVSRENPHSRPAELDKGRVERLARATRDLAWRSYRHGGVTNDLDTYASLRNCGMTYQQARFHVFGRDGAPCSACGASVRRLQVAGRRLYCCPTCQNICAPDRRDD